MAKVSVQVSRDAEEQAASLAGWQQRYEQLGCGRFHGTAWQLVVQDGTLLRESVNVHHRQTVVPPPRHTVVALARAVREGSTFNGRSLHESSLMVFDASAEHELVSAGAIELIGVAADLGQLSTLAAEKCDWLRACAQRTSLQLSPAVAANITNVFAALIAEAADAEPASEGQEHDMIAIALEGVACLAMTDAAAQGPQVLRRLSWRRNVVRRALDFMRAHLYEEIGVQEICDAAFASRRSLQYCFWELLRTTPQAYLRALRLNAAREALKSGSVLRITELASTLCFSHASHFTRLYREMFEELPSGTRSQTH